jgi:hypothetical protein
MRRPGKQGLFDVIQAVLVSADPAKSLRLYQCAKDRGWSTRIMEGGHVVSVSHPVELVKLMEEAPAKAKAAVTH